MEFMGIKWVGVNPENGQKLLLSIIFIIVIVVLRSVLRWIAGRAMNSTGA